PTVNEYVVINSCYPIPYSRLATLAPLSALILFQTDRNRDRDAKVYALPPGKKLQSASRWFFERYVHAAVERGSFPRQLAPSPIHRFQKLGRSRDGRELERRRRCREFPVELHTG